MLKPFYNTQPSDVIEIGVDEAGRGPMFGPVCAAAVILPKTDSIYDLGSIKSGDANAFAFGVMDESIERIVNKFGVTTYYKIFGHLHRPQSFRRYMKH